MIYPAHPGWRVVLVDRENGPGSVALPIVAWCDSRDGDPRYLECFYIPNETGAIPQRLEGIVAELLCGYLPPGQEHESYWDDVAAEVLKAVKEAEERDYERLSSGSAS